MALSFQNQGIATAKIGTEVATGDVKTLSLAGINGELTDATKFATAIETMLDVVGFAPIYDSSKGYGDYLRRITTQKVAGTKE